MKFKIISLSFILCLSFSCQNEKFAPLEEQSVKKQIVADNNELAENPQLKSVTECNNICDNCVIYVACKLRVNGFSPLGTDCTYYSAKLGIINTGSNYVPQWGDVAIFDTGTQYGHMAFVEWTSPWTGQIFISESNWDGNCVSWRQNGRRADYPGLKGFYHPQRQ